MPHTTIFKIEKNGLIKKGIEIKDAKGMQPLIWSIFSEKILGNKMQWLTNIKEARKVWNYWKDPLCENFESFLILCTFDKIVIEGHKIKEALEFLKIFFKENKISPEESNSFPEIIEYLEKNKNSECYGICFHHNSLAPNHWEIDDEKENFIQEKEHFGIFSSIKNKNLILPEKFSKIKFTKKEENNEP